ILDAIEVPESGVDCEATMATLALVPGQASIDLACRVPTNGDTRYPDRVDAQQRMILHVVGGKLTTLLAFDGGATATPSASDKAARGCTIGPVGAASVVDVKGAPRLRVRRAPDGGQAAAAGSGAACKRQRAVEQDYRWDAATSKLVADGAARPVTIDTCDCAH